ncbi:hypothetical protein FKM82_003676 [Ascaphus truei]
MNQNVESRCHRLCDHISGRAAGHRLYSWRSKKTLHYLTTSPIMMTSMPHDAMSLQCTTPGVGNCCPQGPPTAQVLRVSLLQHRWPSRRSRVSTFTCLRQVCNPALHHYHLTYSASTAARDSGK